MFAHRLTMKACTSALAGGGPVECWAVLVGGAALTVVGAPAPAQPVSAASSPSAALLTRPRTTRSSGAEDTVRVTTGSRFMTALPYWPGQAAAACWHTRLSLLPPGLKLVLRFVTVC